MRPALAAACLLVLSLPGLAQVPTVPQPGVIPLLDDAAQTVNDATSSLPVGGDVADATALATASFHGLATEPNRFTFDYVSPVNDDDDESAVTDGLDFPTTVDARSAGSGIGGIRTGDTYTVQAQGTYSLSADTRYAADPECSQAPGDAVWRPHRFTATYGADLGDIVLKMGGSTPVYVDWVPNQPWPAGSPHSADCSSDNAYTAQVKVSSWWMAAAVADPQLGDNAGSAEVRVTGGPPQYPASYACPEWLDESPSTVKSWVGELDYAEVQVDAHRDGNQYPVPKNFAPWLEPWAEAGHNGIYTCHALVPWETYDITVSGTYTYAADNPLNHPLGLLAGSVPALPWDPAPTLRSLDQQHNLGDTFDAPLADAECQQGLADDAWMSHRPEFHVAFNDNGHIRTGEDYFDLALNQLWVKWFPKSGGEDGCDPGHEYVLKGYSPDRIGPLHLWIKDSRYAEVDNIGVLSVTIQKVS